MMLIPLTQGKVALVDDEDYDFLSQWKWYACKYGDIYYARRHVPPNKKITMHRQILKPTHGMDVDHIDMNGLNNQRSNIRLCTRAQNMRNKTGYENTSSRFKGVYWVKRDKKWRAYINFNSKRTQLGCFETEEDAAKAYNEKAKELHGEFARLNINEA